MTVALVAAGIVAAGVWVLNVWAVHKKLDLILMSVRFQGDAIMADLSALTAAVADDATVDASAITLLEGLAAALAEAKTDPAAVQALADQLTAQSAALAAAVVANTPAA